MKRSGDALPQVRQKQHCHDLGQGSWVDEPRLPPELHLDASAFEQLWALHPAEKGRIKMRGKEVETPRWQQAYDYSYRFSGMDHEAVPLPAMLQKYLQWANTLPQLRGYDGAQFNATLVNWYLDGSHYIGPHADDEKQMLTKNGESLVLSLSFGQERVLRLKSKDGKGGRLDLKMSNNSALLMGGLCQRTHTHQVPKVGGRKGAKMGRRINVTFRLFHSK